MPHELTEQGPVMVLRWLQRPDLAELNVVSDRLEAWAGTAPERRGLVVVLTPGMTVPEGAVRERLQARIGALLPRLGYTAMVVEGSGLMAESKRLFVRALTALVGIKRMQLFATQEEALRAVPPGLG